MTFLAREREEISWHARLAGRNLSIPLLGKNYKKFTQVVVPFTDCIPPIVFELFFKCSETEIDYCAQEIHPALHIFCSFLQVFQQYRHIEMFAVPRHNLVPGNFLNAGRGG